MPRIGSPERQASRALAERLRRVESPNVTYVEDHPPFWTRALGANVEDADGNVYLDFTGAFGVAFAGHRHPVVVEAVSGQIQRLVHGMGDIHPPAPKVELLEALASMAPWPEAKGILGCSGSDAVEAALKTAHMASGRAGILAFEGAYHGLALGALAATDRDHFRRPFTDRLKPHVTFAPFPTTEEELGRGSRNGSGRSGGRPHRSRHRGAGPGAGRVYGSQRRGSSPVCDTWPAAMEPCSSSTRSSPDWDGRGGDLPESGTG